MLLSNWKYMGFHYGFSGYKEMNKRGKEGGGGGEAEGGTCSDQL